LVYKKVFIVMHILYFCKPYSDVEFSFYFIIVMKEIFAQRFKSARLMKGYSLQDLADALGNQWTRQSLFRYEKGEVIPDSNKINLLGKALCVDPGYFFRTTQVELGDVEFRKLSKMPQKEAVIIREVTKEKLSRYLELEEILGLSNAFDDCLNDFELVTGYEQVNRAASLLRERWDLGNVPIYNIVELLEGKNIKVLDLRVNDDFDGLQTRVNASIPVIAYNANKISKPERVRFTLLHELAHLLLKFGDISEKQKEVLCNQFAGAMLLPEKMLKKELGKRRNDLSINELGGIKEQYGISMQAIVMRARDCGVISHSYTKQFFFFIKQMNWIGEEPIEYLGVEESNRFQQLLYKAMLEEKISMSKAAELNNQSLAEFRKGYQMLY
jgi:Zn-dependent peptidase ImmA (M78 family)/DNA-binding XRE family transcriptional regulator